MPEEKLPWEEISAELPVTGGPDSSPPQEPFQGEAGPAPAKTAKTPAKYSKELKLKVTLEALRGGMTQREVGEKYGVPQPLVSLWKANGITAISKDLDERPGKGGMTAARKDYLANALSQAEALGIQRLCETLRETAKLLEDAPRALRALKQHVAESNEQDPRS